MNLTHKILPVLAGIAVSFIFGLSFLFSKSALDTLKPLELLAHRFSLAVVFLLIAARTGLINLRFRPGMFRDLFPLTLFQPVLYFLGETFGVNLTTATESGLVIALIPVAVTLLGKYYLHEKATWLQWTFIWLSVVGVAIIVLAPAGLVLGRHAVGVLCLLIAVIAAAIYNVLARKFSGKYSPLEITAVMMITGAVIFNLLYLIALSPKAVYFSAFTDRKALISLVYLGGLSSVLAFFLMNYMLKRMSASRAATFINLTTVVSVAAGVVFRGETFGLMQVLGGILILAGVWGSNFCRMDGD